jgi:hypothetical protein
MHQMQLSSSAAKGRPYMCQVRGNPQRKFASDSGDLAGISISWKFVQSHEGQGVDS